MGNASSTPKITAQDKAILQVKLQKDKLVKYQKKMSLLIVSERDQIKLYLSKNDKNSAKTLLKRQKFQEKLLDNVSDQIFNLENMIHNIEFKLIEKEFLKGLTNGNAILTKLNKEMDISDVEKLVEEVNENIAYQEEIDQILSNATIGKDLDDELDEELRDLEIEVMGKRNTDTVKTKVEDLGLPSVAGLSEIKDQEKESDVVSESKGEKVEERRTPLLA